MTKSQKDNQSSSKQSNYFDGNAGPEELAHLLLGDHLQVNLASFGSLLEKKEG